jgi:hypothetical protein
MKKIILFVVVILMSLSLYADESVQGDFCPIALNLHWTYGLFSKKENLQKEDLKTFIVKKETFDNSEYFVYEVPGKSMTLYGRMEKSGIILKNARVNLPVLGFIIVDVVFDPPVVLLKLPFKTGDSWHYEGKATARTMAFINLEQKIFADIYVVGEEKINFNGMNFDTFHVKGTVSRSWKTERPISGDCWIARDIGLVKGETLNTRLELKEFSGK